MLTHCPFNSSKSCFKPKFLLQSWNLAFIKKCHYMCMCTKVQHLLWNEQLNTVSPLLGFIIRYVIKATPIHLINDKCNIKKLKSCRICLTSYYGFISCDLLLMALGADTQTQIQSHTYTCCGQEKSLEIEIGL